MNLQQMGDDDIITKIKSGQTQLFEEITNRYLQKISNYVYNMVNYNNTIVQDIVHDVFLKVYQNLDKYSGGNFNAWIYRIAHSETVNFIRKNTDQHYDSDKITKSYDFDSDSIDIKYKKQLIKQILSRLTGEYKEVIILYYFEGKSYDEIGEILNKPKNTIGTYISRAKDKIKDIVKNDQELTNALEI